MDLRPRKGDCDDENETINPQAVEIWDGVENDCNRLIDEAPVCVGCADGSREGFVDADQFPDIAACAGVFSGHIGDTSANSLCATGWHVCSPPDVPHDAAIVSSVTFEQAKSFSGCFAFNAAHDFGKCIPCTGGWGEDDMGGAGSDCKGTYNGGSSSCWGSGRIDAVCCSDYQSGTACQHKPYLTGVVCCREL